MRVVHGKDSVEKNLQSKLTKRNHKMDDLFKVVTLEMKQKPKKSEKAADGEVLDDKGRKTVLRTGVRLRKLSLLKFDICYQVVCSDPDELVQTKIAEYGLDIHKAMVKVGIDGGQGTLKFATTIEEMNDASSEPDRKISAYKDVSYKVQQKFS